MIDACFESHLRKRLHRIKLDAYFWRLERILGRKVYIKEENAAFVNRSGRSEQCGNPFKQVITTRKCTRFAIHSNLSNQDVVKTPTCNLVVDLT